MSINYNTFKSMKGMAIGTIIPWSGPLSGDYGIPKGWMACTTNRVLNVDDYPELFEVIGNRYGGTVADGTFALPSLPGKSLCDYHPSHANVTGIGYTGNFSSFLGSNNDVANSLPSRSSNIDCRLSIGSTSELQGNMTGMNLNFSRYSTSFGFVPRRLGDLHWGSHSHGGSYPSVRLSDNRIEACQESCGTNCASIGVFGVCIPAGCQDDCENDRIYRSGNSSNAIDDFCIPRYDGGEHLGRGRVPYGTNGYKMQRKDNPRNYLLPNDDTVLTNQVSSDPGVGTGNDGAWSGIYGTTLNTQIVNFQNAAMTGHDHKTQFLTVDSGNLTTRETVRINTIATGNISPVNADNTEVMTITIDPNTPSLQMMYIIKAY